MRHYETIYIINPNLTDEDCKEVIAKFNDLIEKQKGVIVKVKEWGRQRLAYLVKKFDKGYYVLTDFCGDPGVTSAFERDLRLDDRVLKYQTIKLEDNVDPQELLLKEKENEVGKSETARPKEDAPEGEKASGDETVTSDKEVKNGV